QPLRKMVKAFEIKQFFCYTCGIHRRIDMSVSLKNTLKRAAMHVGAAAVSFSQMGCGGDDPVNPKEPGGTTPPVVQKGSFKVVGDLARLDMAGTDRIPASVTRPEIPPTITKLFAYYNVNGKEQY